MIKYYRPCTSKITSSSLRIDLWLAVICLQLYIFAVDIFAFDAVFISSGSASEYIGIIFIPLCSNKWCTILQAGVGVHSVSTLIGGLTTTYFSDFAGSISGTHIYPSLVFSSIALTIVGTATAAEAIPTLLFSIVFSTFIVGVLFFLLGKFRLTRVVQFVPASLLGGFMACIGYKTLKAAFGTATGDVAFYAHLGDARTWKLLLPR